ncbi:hypothetical protein J7L68_02690 [bacterium]|nr:hypothetical protein [bacterium]
MRKATLLLVVIGIVMMASSVFATDARLSAFGYGAKYISDANNMIYTPVAALSYKNQVQFELGNYTGGGATPFGQWGLFNLGLGENLVIGAAVRRTDGQIFSIANDMGTTSPNPGINLWGAYNLGSVKLGLGVYRASYGEKQTDNTNNTDNEYKSSVLSIRASAGMDILGGVAATSFNVDLNGLSAEAKNSSNQTYTDETTGGMEIGFKFRAFLPATDNVKIVPAIAFSTFSHSREINDYSGNVTDFGDYTNMNLDIGCAVNTQILDDGVVSVGVGMNMLNIKDELVSTAKTEDKTLTLPQLSISTEIPTTDWLYLRTGISKSFGSITHTENDIDSVMSFNETNTVFASFGAGIKFHDFNLDLTFADDDLFEGFWFLSGRTVNAVQLSASYNWE